MDWSERDEITQIRDLARQILTTSQRPWEDLVESGFTELEDAQEICALLEEVGAAGGAAPTFKGVAEVPALETLVLGAPLRKLGHPPADAVLTAGLLEAHSPDPRHPTTRGVGGRLWGQKICVPAADRAAQIAVPAGDAVYAVDLSDCTVTPQIATGGVTLGVVTLDGAPGKLLHTAPGRAAGGRAVFDWWLPLVSVGLSALHLGLARGALELTVRYAGERQQFGRPIGMFQAVSQRVADAWIDLQAMEVTLRQAAWRLDAGLSAEREVAIARFWATEGSHRILAAAQHVHGGTGFDRDYPLHRLFETSKLWEFLMGGASAQLEGLGDLLASSASPGGAS